ncbi:MAG TPA: glutamyl-tRNA reductase [Dehalococcoidia bacterium]|nr:glutamyl-tRNA reductase [Dehalococcoidia bacterium]
MKSRVVTCVGLNHHTSPIEEREKLAFTSAELAEALAALKEKLAGAAILSTCNRTELYTAAPEGAAGGLIDTLTALKGATVAAEHFYVMQGAEAVEHLYRVAAGVDSMVLGESQILGQVREAMSAATEAGTLDGVLSHVFHTAISLGKRVRTETEIGRHAVSVSSAAVALARKSLGDLENKTVLVISAGSMGKLAAKALAQQTGSGRILVANRTQERASDLAEQLGPNTEALDLGHLRDALAVSDIVISGTSAEDFILGPADVWPVMAGREDRGLLFIDIAVPRDIDPAVVEIAGVHLCDIDDIEAVTSEGWNGRQAEVSKVEAIVEEQVAAFGEWWDSLDVVPVISALRERAEAIRRAELERTFSKMPDLDDASRARIEAMTEAIVKKMLDRPIARLKDGADKGLYMEALEDLFDVHSAPARRARP